MAGWILVAESQSRSATGKANSHVPIALRASRLSADGCLGLSAGQPLFTRRLVDGIGIAEDPGNGQSFGQLRTQLLAQAFVDAHQAGRLHGPEVMNDVDSRFRQAGLELRRPHVNPGSVDWYAR